MKLIFLAFLASAIVCEVVPAAPGPSTLPESQKLQITLPHTGKKIQIVAEQPVEKVYTESTAVQMVSPTGEVLNVRPKNFKTSKVTPELEMIKKRRPIQYDNRYIKSFYQSRRGGRRAQVQVRARGRPNRGLQLGQTPDNFAPTSDGINAVGATNTATPTPSPANNYFISEADMYRLSHNIDMDIHTRKLAAAFQNLANLESQFKSLLNEFSVGHSNYTTDANTRALITNMVTHIEYIKTQQATRDGTKAPMLYNYYTQNEMGIMDMMTLTQWETFKKENAINGMIKAKTSPLAITPQASYGVGLFDYAYGINDNRRNLRRIPRVQGSRRAQAVEANPNELRVTTTPSPFDGYTRVNLPQKLSKEQLAVNILKVDGIQSHYDILFRMLPKTTDVPANLDQLLFQDALVIFHKVSQFATITYMTLENIWNDLNEIDIFFKALPNTLLNTLSFYRLDDDYLALKCKYGNNTQGYQTMQADFTKVTDAIQKLMDEVLVLVFNCKMDVNTVLAQTKVYRDYKGAKNLYSQEFQSIMRQSLADVKLFQGEKDQVIGHLELLRQAQIRLRDEPKELVALLEKHRKLAGAARVAALAVTLVVGWLVW